MFSIQTRETSENPELLMGCLIRKVNIKFILNGKNNF